MWFLKVCERYPSMCCRAMDAPVLPELLNQIPPDQDISNVTADGAYDTRKCHEAIAARDAHAVIPPRKNAKPWKPTSAGAIARNDAVNAHRYLGRALWRRWSGYHRRSRVETKRNENALSEITGPIAHGAGLRKAGRGNPNPHRSPQPLHRSWHTCHRGSRLSPSGERGSSPSGRFAQQSPLLV
ncbi:MAG: hypothetical protein ACI8TF_000301 [Paracoccaceae bacterium]|jgi:hypothetical protein